MKLIALAAAGLLLLSGCDSEGSSDYALYYQAVRQSIAASFSGNAQITKKQAAAIPYASIGYRVNGGPEQLLVLATDNGEEQLWTSAAHVVIVTRGGRIVRTVGLIHDVAAVTPPKGQELVQLGEVSGTAVRATRLEDFIEIPIYGAPVQCTDISKGVQTIVILGRGITTRKVDEDCRSQQLNWSFTDAYWIDLHSSLVWRSIQHLSPMGEKIEIEMLRPPG